MPNRIAEWSITVQAGSIGQYQHAPARPTTSGRQEGRAGKGEDHTLTILENTPAKHALQHYSSYGLYLPS